MRGMLSGRRRRETEDTARIGALVRQPAVDEPVEHAVQSHPVKGHVAQPDLDFTMRQRGRRLAQHAQNPDTSRRRPRAETPDLFSNSLLAEGDIKSHVEFS